MNREPDKINEFEDKYWHDDNGKLHNDFGYPAIIFADGLKRWYKHGVRHNDFGPAIIYSWGDKEWYIDGKEYSEKEFLQYKIKNFINE